MTVLSRVSQFFAAQPMGRTAAAQSAGAMSPLDLQAAAWDRVQDWTRQAAEAVRHNGTLNNHLLSISSLAASGIWEAKRRNGMAAEADTDERVQRFIHSLDTLDLGRCVRRHETVGSHWLIPWPDSESLIRWDEASTSELRIFDVRKPPEIARHQSIGFAPLYPETLDPRLRPAVLRVWRPDDEWRAMAWSPVASVLQHIEALHLMTLAEMASDRNRLASAGLIFFPNDIAGIDPRDPSKSATFASITRAATTAIKDPTSVSSVVPVFLTGPRDSGEKIRHLIVERRENPAEFESRRKSHLEELARSLSSPAGRVLGTEGDAKYANAMAMDFDTLRTYLPSVTNDIVRVVNDVYRSVRESWGLPTFGYRLNLSFDHLGPDVDRTQEALELRREGVLTVEGVAEMAKIPKEWRLKPESAEYKRWLTEQGVRRGTQNTLGGPQSIVKSTHAPDPVGALPAAGGRLASLAEIDLALGVVAAASHVETDREILMMLGDQAIATDTKVNLASVAINGNLLFKGLGLSRDEMPQLDGDRQQKFLDALKADGVEVGKPAEVDPATLWASQSELSARKAREISLAKNLDEILAEPIIVSENDFVLDGHHRFVAAIMMNKQIMAVRVGLTIVPLLERADEFAGKAKTFTAAATTTASSDWATVLAGGEVIDRTLHAQLHGAATVALADALRRAGVKAFNKASTGQRKVLAEVPRKRVVAALGATMMAAYGLTDDDLLVNATDDLSSIAGDYIDAAYRGADWRGATISPDWKTEALVVFADGFMAAARTALYADAEATGIPHGLIALVVAKAGGMRSEGPDQIPVGGPGQNMAVRNAIVASGTGLEYVWRWGHFGVPTSPFGPHFTRNGSRWVSLDDPGLVNPVTGESAWTGKATLHPLDHDGCTCALVLEVKR